MARELVQIHKENHGFFQELTSKHGERKPLFPLMKDVFMFAFVVGARNGERKPLGSPLGIFGTEVFQPDEIALMQGVYLSDTEDVMGLEDPEAPNARVSGVVLETAEEYSNAGVEIMRQHYNAVLPELPFAHLLADAEF